MTSASSPDERSIRRRLIARLEGISERNLLLLLGCLFALSLAVLIGHEFVGKNLSRAFQGSMSYRRVAENLVNNGSYSLDGITPYGRRPPAYPFLLAAIMRLLGDRWIPGAIAVQSMIGIACGFMTYWIARALFKDRLIAVIAALLYAGHIQLQLETLGQSSTLLFMFALLLFFLVICRGGQGAGAYALLAICVALAHLSRPNGSFLLLPLLLYWLRPVWKTGLNLRHLGNGMLALLLYAAAVAPWQIYLYQRLHVATVFSADYGQRQIYTTNTPMFYEVYPWIDIDGVFNQPIKGMPLNEWQEQHQAGGQGSREMALNYIKAHPVRIALWTVAKGLLLYSPVPIPVGLGEVVYRDGQIHIEKFSLGSPLLFWPATLHGIVLLGGAAVFLVQACRRRQPWPWPLWCLAAFLALLTAAHMVSHSETRYRIPADPILAAMAGAAFAGWLRTLNRSAACLSPKSP